jgi:hypothetical protein
MTPVVVNLPTVDALRRYVHAALCTQNDLDPRYTPLHELLVQRQGQPCGLFFHIQGPRLLKAYAVWSADEGRILFYDAKGERCGETRLSEGPDPSRLAA